MSTRLKLISTRLCIIHYANQGSVPRLLGLSAVLKTAASLATELCVAVMVKLTRISVRCPKQGVGVEHQSHLNITELVKVSKGRSPKHNLF